MSILYANKYNIKMSGTIETNKNSIGLFLMQKHKVHNKFQVIVDSLNAVIQAKKMESVVRLCEFKPKHDGNIFLFTHFSILSHLLKVLISWSGGMVNISKGNRATAFRSSSEEEEIFQWRISSSTKEEDVMLL